MSDHVRDVPSTADPSHPSTPSTAAFAYPYAAAPDIIRSHQKDSYFQSHLLTHLESIIRGIYGARTAHAWTTEARTFTELLYLTLTTFAGNRTLGEEYTDIVQISTLSHRLPSLVRRAAYILTSVLFPYALTRLLPRLRAKLRAKLATTLRRKQHTRTTTKSPPTWLETLQTYTHTHLDTLTSPAPLQALVLTVFYFTGAYYTLAKRLTGLRYIFTRRLPESSPESGAQPGGRVGYEVLGVLLLCQIGVQTYVHVQDTWRDIQGRRDVVASAAGVAGGSAMVGGREVGTGAELGAGGENLLFETPYGSDEAGARQSERLARMTETPVVGKEGTGGRYDLEDEEVMGWIDGRQQRKCTLCLEAMKDPAATTCGHVFCWTCVTDWLREQPMCPLCRQSALVQHVLPLRG